MIYEHSSFRSFLLSSYQERLKRNNKFSLRAYARQLGMSPSGLSEVLNGKKNLSTAKGIEISNRLGLKSKEKEYFLNLIRMDSTKSLEEKSHLQELLQKLNPRKQEFESDVEEFRMISEWYHIPILELTDVSGVEITPKSISILLGITLHEAQEALNRLLRLGLLREHKGKLTKTKKSFVFRSETANAALRHYHRQMLNKIEESLETQTPQQKFSGTETFAFDASDVETAKEIIESCFDDLIALSLKGKKRKQLYHLNVHFFNLLKITEREK